MKHIFNNERMTMRNIILVLLFGLFVGCGSDYETSMMRNENRTLADCLASIKRASGSSKLEIITDKQKEVSGFLQNGEHFACNRKSSGTKGVYYEGVYTVKTKKVK